MTSINSIKTWLTLACYSLLITACNNANTKPQETTAESINTTVKIGTQVWATQNVATTTFRNGDAIPEATTNAAWTNAGKEKKPAWCYYDNDAENGKKYGKLYNWYAVSDPRGLAPKGYHIPTSAELELLVAYLGSRTVAGVKLKTKTGWSENGNGTNEAGFLAVPGGARYDFGSFDDKGYSAVWWTNNQQEILIGLNGLIWYSDNYVNTDNTNGPGAGLSVRCIKD